MKVLTSYKNVKNSFYLWINKEIDCYSNLIDKILILKEVEEITIEFDFI
jgi:hypothetical protein